MYCLPALYCRAPCGSCLPCCCRGEAYWKRSDLEELHTADRWRRLGREVLPEELPHPTKRIKKKGQPITGSSGGGGGGGGGGSPWSSAAVAAAGGATPSLLDDDPYGDAEVGWMRPHPCCCCCCCCCRNHLTAGQVLWLATPHPSGAVALPAPLATRATSHLPLPALVATHTTPHRAVMAPRAKTLRSWTLPPSPPSTASGRPRSGSRRRQPTAGCPGMSAAMWRCRHSPRHCQRAR